MDGSLASMIGTLLWVIFSAAAALSMVLGLVLAYHWGRFSLNAAVPILALTIYAVGCLILLFIMFVAALTI